MIEFYPQIKWIHVAAVMLSGGLFGLRGLLMLARSPHANHAVLRYVSYAIDTTLLTAALMLVSILHPFGQAWLSVKLLLLVVYVVLGTLALKRGRTRTVQVTCYFAALAVFAFIVGIARAHDPWGVLAPWLS